MSQFESTGDQTQEGGAGPWGDSSAVLESARPAARPSLFERAALVILVSVMGATAVGLGLIIAQGQLSGDSRAYANTAVDEITLRWDEDALVSRATPALAAQVHDRLDPLFASLKATTLDPANEGCRGRAGLGFHGLRDPEPVATYDCPLETRGRPLDIDLVLKKDGGVWRIDDFAVISPGQGRA